MRDLIKQTKNKISKEILGFFSSLPSYVKMFKAKSLSIKILLVMFLFFFNISGSDFGSRIKGEEGDISIEKSLDPKEVYASQVKEKVYDKLYWEVRTYMDKTAPDSKLDPDYLIKKCLEYDMDIIFVLAQAILESHLGTKGKAAITNSVWNVGTYDNGQILYTYSNPNESVEPYMELLKKKYLIHVTAKGDTIYKDLHHLVEDRGYINYKGDRFASAWGYENSMRKLIIKIDMETSIGFYQDILSISSDEMIAYFVPEENLEINYSLLQAMR